MEVTGTQYLIGMLTTILLYIFLFDIGLFIFHFSLWAILFGVFSALFVAVVSGIMYAAMKIE